MGNLRRLVRRPGHLGRHRGRRRGRHLAGQAHRGQRRADSRNAIAPALLVAQAVGRIGNYFNQELFGKPSGLPWALEISPARDRPAGYLAYSTFQPSFLYELIFDLALAAFAGLARPSPQDPALGAVRALRGGLLRRTGSSRRRIRIDSSEHFLGLRLNFYVATIVTLIGIAWFIRAQRAPAADGGTGSDVAGSPGGAALAEPGGATATAGPADDGDQRGAQGELEASARQPGSET